MSKITPEIREKLRAPFPPEAYSQHPTKKFLTTLKAMYSTERMNDVFGIGRWTIDHEVVFHENEYVLVKGKLRLLDFDCEIPEQYGGHATGGKGTEPADGYKSAITDLLSKSFSYLEIGLELFKGNITQQNGFKQEVKTPFDIIEIKKELTGKKDLMTKDEIDNFRNALNAQNWQYCREIAQNLQDRLSQEPPEYDGAEKYQEAS
jgi:hypothetical protein